MICIPPRRMATTGVDTRGALDAESAEEVRKRAIRVYLCISLTQAITGIGVLVCSGSAVHYHSNSGFPYFAGSFAIGITLTIASMVAFRVYNKGPYFSSCDEVRMEVLCALNWHRGLSFFMFFICIFGLAIVWMYGLCLTDDTVCSYETNIRTNKLLATIAFVLGAIGMVTCAIGVAIIRKFGSAFGLQSMEGRRGVLRYVGFHEDVLNELRRQNEEMQRQLGQQNRYPNTPSGSEGFTNFGFEPPTPPPYSPTSVSSSVLGCNSTISSTPNTDGISSGSISFNPPKYSDLEYGAVLPSEPPPPYKETADDNEDGGGRDSSKL